jgi:hypothetical protein
MKKEEIIEKLEDGKDYVVRTPEEEQEFLNNYAAAEVDKRIGDRIGKVYGDIDKDIEATIGKQKPDGVKTYDFLKDVLSDYKSRADSVSLIERELSDAKKALREKGSDTELKTQYENLEKRYNKAIEDFKKEKSEMEGKFVKQRIGSMIDSAMGKVKVNKNIPESAVKALMNTTRSELLESAVLRDDELQFKKGDDILVDSTYSPVKVDALLNDRLKDIIDTGGKTGTGTQPGQQGEAGEIVPPDSAMVNLDELAKYLQESLIIKKGYTKNTVRKSDEYIQLFGKYSKMIK